MYMCFLIKIVHNINSLEECSVEKKIPVFFQDFLKFFFPWTFPGLRIYDRSFSWFSSFSSVCVWEPDQSLEVFGGEGARFNRFDCKSHRVSLDFRSIFGKEQYWHINSLSTILVADWPASQAN